LSLDPIRSYTDLQISPWEDTIFAQKQGDGTVYTIPVFSGKYEYEITVMGTVAANSDYELFLGTTQEEKILLRVEGSNSQVLPQRIRFVVSNIEAEIPLTQNPGSSITDYYYLIHRRTLRLL